MEAIVAVIGLIGTAAAATIAAYAGTRQRIRAELDAEYDSDLRKSRLAVYPALWRVLQPLAKYARDAQGFPARAELTELSRELRRWYFETGGLYLSAESREAYFNLQDALGVVLASERWNGDESDCPEEIDKETFEALRRLGSWLRTAMTYDVGTRRRFSLAPEWSEADDAANAKAFEDDQRAREELTGLLDQVRAAWPASVAAPRVTTLTGR